MNNVGDGQVWYYYDVPDAKPEPQPVPILSQVPVLNGVLEVEVEKPKPRRGGEEITSKYIRLAKAGGRKDLLLYRDHVPSPENTKTYQRADWFDHPDTDIDTSIGTVKIRHQPLDYEKIRAQANNKNGPVVGSGPPFSVDNNNTSYEEDNKEQYLTKNARRQRELNRLRVPISPTVPPKKESNVSDRRLIRPPLGESNEPVSFSHLISHGYQADWSKNNTETRKQKMEAKKKDDKEKKERFAQHLKTSPRAVKAESDKPLFKMKRFQNAESKVFNQ